MPRPPLLCAHARSAHAQATVSAALVLWALSACESSADEPDDAADLIRAELPFEYSTTHLEIHSDIERCEGDFARWEGFIDYAETTLDLDMDPGVELYVWETDNFDGMSLCGSTVNGCFHPAEGFIDTIATSVEHELVHALTAALANRDAFFSEGLAEALAESTEFGAYGPTFPLARPKQVDYRSAGHFVRWLLEVYGPTPLITHMSAVGGVEEFEAIFGVELSELSEQFFTTASWKYPRSYDYPAPALEAAGDGTWSSVLEFSCDRDDVRGTADGLEAIRELTIPEFGTYAFWSSTGGRIRGRAKTVAAEPNTGSVFGSAFEISSGAIMSGPVNAGVYEIGVTAPPGVDSGLIMVWESSQQEPVFPGGTP